MKYKLTATNDEGEILAQIESSSLNIVEEEVYKVRNAIRRYQEKNETRRYPDSFISAREEETKDLDF